MAINKNHLFEDLDGVKCGIAEKNVSTGRVSFLKGLLEYNGYTVIVIPSTSAKPLPASVSRADDAINLIPVTTTSPETFTIGVTDYTFNPINAIFGRLLKSPDGHVVTLAYWQQQEVVSDDETPYFEKNE